MDYLHKGEIGEGFASLRTVDGEECDEAQMLVRPLHTARPKGRIILIAIVRSLHPFPFVQHRTHPTSLLNRLFRHVTSTISWRKPKKTVVTIWVGRLRLWQLDDDLYRLCLARASSPSFMFTADHGEEFRVSATRSSPFFWRVDEWRRECKAGGESAAGTRLC